MLAKMGTNCYKIAATYLFVLTFETLLIQIKISMN